MFMNCWHQQSIMGRAVYRFLILSLFISLTIVMLWFTSEKLHLIHINVASNRQNVIDFFPLLAEHFFMRLSQCFVTVMFETHYACVMFYKVYIRHINGTNVLCRTLMASVPGNEPEDHQTAPFFCDGYTTPPHTAQYVTASGPLK